MSTTFSAEPVRQHSFESSIFFFIIIFIVLLFSGARVLSVRQLFELITDPNLDDKDIDVPNYIATHHDDAEASSEQVLQPHKR